VKPEQKKKEEVVNTHPWYGSAAEGYSAEMSDLGIQHGQLTVMTPAGEISLGAFKPQLDSEGEITHLTVVQSGVSLTIFND
jgi:hypothetical protein